MTINDFHRFPPAQQFQTVVEQGTFLCSRRVRPHSTMLYALGNFLVKIIYCLDDPECISLTAFKTTRQVGPYLEGLRME